MTTKSLKDGAGSAFDADLNLALGEQADAASKSVVLSTGSKALVGGVTETAPASDTASSGLNGRLQRVAQRLTSLIALLPTSLGTKTAANSLAVTLASDGAIGAQADASATSDTGTFSLIALFKRSLGYLSTLATAASSAATANVNLGTEALSKSDGTQLTPKFATISASASGSNSIVAAVTGKKIRVLQFSLIANGTVNAKFRSAAATDKTGLYYLVANSGLAPPFCPLGLFETTSGEALTLDLSAAIAVGGQLVYVEV